MSSLSVFSFEKQSVRTLGTPEVPLFVAIDVAKALGYSQPAKSVNDRVDTEDLIKAEIDTKGGRQTVNCVNESGLYALIFGSKLESAKRFKRWVTSEVLPAIRKTGRYESQPPEFISEAQQREIQRAVGRKAAPTRSFAAVYRALKDHFQIPRYTCLLAKDFDAAIAFINALDVATLEPPQPKEPPMILPPDPKPAPQLSDEDMKSLLIFVFMVRYFFADAFNKFYALLKCTNSPLAGQCWDAFHEVNWFRIIDVLAANGHDINDLPYFRHWKARRSA